MYISITGRRFVGGNGKDPPKIFQSFIYLCKFNINGKITTNKIWNRVTHNVANKMCKLHIINNQFDPHNSCFHNNTYPETDFHSMLTSFFDSECLSFQHSQVPWDRGKHTHTHTHTVEHIPEQTPHVQKNIIFRYKRPGHVLRVISQCFEYLIASECERSGGGCTRSLLTYRSSPLIFLYVLLLREQKTAAWLGHSGLLRL